MFTLYGNNNETFQPFSVNTGFTYVPNVLDTSALNRSPSYLNPISNNIPLVDNTNINWTNAGLSNTSNGYGLSSLLRPNLNPTGTALTSTGLNTGLTATPTATNTVGNTGLTFDQIKDLNNQWTNKDTFNAVGTGISALGQLAGIWQANKANKIAAQQLAEASALQRANYKLQAKTLNAQYRDQVSGRGTAIMGRGTKSALGRTYADRRINETYE